MNTKILLVDDEKDIVEFLEYNLSKEGFEVITAYDGEEAIEKLKYNPDLVLLDVMMPKLDGYQVCSKIRKMEKFQNTPVIFLTAKSSEIDEIQGLNLGADDYISKPISPKVLVARVKSNLRRKAKSNNEDAESIITAGPLIINKDTYTVQLEGSNVVLPKKEFEILSYLAQRPGKVLPRERILNDVWGTDVFVVERTIDVHVRKIREKLGDHSTLVETVKGVGYRFKKLD